MIKSITTMALAGLVALTITGCGGATATPAEEVLDERCRDDSGMLAPEWVCTSSIEGAEYAAVGIGSSKNASMREAQAMTRARAKLAYQVNTKVKAKMEDFMRSTGNADAETMDAVTTAVTKQTAKLDLSGSRKVKTFRSKDGKLYVLVAVSDASVNQKVKNTMKTSMGNEQALWQQFQSKQALDSLDKEFPTD
ncbi:MAG: LPP20 family lipoprotein [Campylobacterota bacterium]|nr:LPP20 family lipoprotein [Campylobacterota bacterium]